MISVIYNIMLSMKSLFFHFYCIVSLILKMIFEAIFLVPTLKIFAASTLCLCKEKKHMSG